MRRMGKTGMTQRCFLDKRINDSYYMFFVDIYAIKSLHDFVYSRAGSTRLEAEAVGNTPFNNPYNTRPPASGKHCGRHITLQVLNCNVPRNGI